MVLRPIEKINKSNTKSEILGTNEGNTKIVKLIVNKNVNTFNKGIIFWRKKAMLVKVTHHKLT
jgi:hypothetical protein